MTLMAPGLPQSRDEIKEQLCKEFDEGFRDAAKKMPQCIDPQERALLYQVLQNSRPMWLFSRLTSFDSVVDYQVLDNLWRHMNTEKWDLLVELRSRQSWDPYLRLHADIKEEDRPDEIAERTYFSQRSELDLTVARKLTLVSQWSSRYCQSPCLRLRRNSAAFVADKLLWKWIDQCLKELSENLKH